MITRIDVLTLIIIGLSFILSIYNFCKQLWVIKKAYRKYDGWTLIDDKKPRHGKDVVVCYANGDFFSYKWSGRNELIEERTGKATFWIYKNDLSGWIPFSEQTPRQGERILVWVKTGDVSTTLFLEIWIKRYCFGCQYLIWKDFLNREK